MCGDSFLDDQSDIVDHLLAAGADARANNSRALYLAADSGQSALAALLLEKGANVNAADADSRTALMKAADENDLPFVMLLLAHKADAARQNKEGFTALMLAVGNGDNARYKQRREQQDDHLRSAHGENPQAVPRKDLPNPNGHPDMVRLLLKNGADPNAAAKDGTTPLKLAEKNGFDAVIALLKQAGAK